MKTIITALGLALSPFALGCGPAAGTAPHAMSAAEHEAAASQELQASESHGQQYDAVGIRADDEATSKDILRRSESLKPGSATGR